MRVGGAQIRWVPLFHCVLSARKEGTPPSLCSQCQSGFLEEMSQQRNPFSHRGRAVTTKERDVVRDNKEKEGV